jgi:lysine biosynthesis protein LysW
MAKGLCPACNLSIHLGTSPRKGQIVSCPRCRSQLEVANLSPIELDWVYDEDTEIDNYDERRFVSKFIEK